jgi:hypothetical protein
MRLPIIFATLTIALCLGTRPADAQQKVNVRFNSCGALVDRTGEYQTDAAFSQLIFAHVSVRGDCGAVLYAFNKGELPRSTLAAGDRCLVRATLEERGGTPRAEQLIRIRNDKGRMVARGRTDGNGKVSFRFRNRTATTRYYVLIGPRATDGSERVGCYFYLNQSDCFGPVSVGAQVC